MKGKYSFELYNAVVHYYLTLERNITILQGDSASGKTELIRLLTAYNRSKASSGITLICDKPCSVLTSEDWEARLPLLKGRIIFIDEGNDFVRSKDFAHAIVGKDNYFVLIYRDDLEELPYSITEIYGLRENTTSKYRQPAHVYNEMYRLYTAAPAKTFYTNQIITEDSKAGFQFFDAAFQGHVRPAGGKSLVLSSLREAYRKGQKALAIVDGAAFGSEMNEIHSWLTWHPGSAVFAPESFEYLILSSGIINVPNDILQNTCNYADSIHYLSWEQFYTAYLTSITSNTHYPYQKTKLNGFYKTEGSVKKILASLPKNINFYTGSNGN